MQAVAVPTLRWLGPLYFQRPTEAAIRERVTVMSVAPYTYDAVGQTRGEPPEGFAYDEQEAVIGTGDGVFEAGKAALRRWRQFDLSWVRPHDDTVPLEPGATFAFVSHQLGMTTVNMCRVVYVVDEPDRFGFAYGTVGNHVLRGEELFLLERSTTGEVVFRISKFSLPNHLLVRLAGPLATHAQRRFSLDAIERLRREVAS